MTTGPMKKILFDAHAILRWTQRESGYQKVRSLMIECREKKAMGYMCYINLGEVYYKTIRAIGKDKAHHFLDNFLRLPLNLIVPDADLILKASEIKAIHSISYADCFAAATAIMYKAAILTGDPDFKKLGKLVIVDFL